MKLRIFISSVQKEFAEERRMLADYIRKDALLGVFFEVFLFEEVDACDKTPQGVYLGEVESCDIYIGLLGQKFGHETESGTSATECEYDLATKLGKTRLVFIKDVARREPKEARFIAKVQNDVTRKMFSDFDSLRLGVYSALVRQLEQSGYVRTTPFDASYDTGLTVEDVEDMKVAEFFRRARAAKKLTIPAEADAWAVAERLDGGTTATDA